MKPPDQTTAPPSWHLDGAVLVLSGDWLALAGSTPLFPADALINAGQSLKPDMEHVGQWNSGLIAFLWDARRASLDAGIAFDTTGLPESAQKLLGLLPDRVSQPPAAKRRPFRPLTWLGSAVLDVLTETGILSTLLTGTVYGGLRAVVGHARMRGVDLLANVRDAGPAALLIVSVVNFLLGAILAFVGAVQLSRFAADIYVANMVAIALVREMSAVMTAIIMTGRTGGAYAARIATMQGNEEIDALQVIGIPVTDYLLLPAILSLAFTMPFLYLYGCLVGMLGGFVVSIAMLNVTGLGYLNQTLGSVGLDQFVFGFVKSIAFAILIGVTSCRIGLKAGRSSADVGLAATNAVVTGIVGIIIVDSMFAVIAEIVGL